MVMIAQMTRQNGVLFFQENILQMNCQMPPKKTESHILSEIFFFMIDSEGYSCSSSEISLASSSISRYL